jgi:hypothetical protein
MDGKWNAAMFFFPAKAISDKHLLLIKGHLKTKRQCRCLPCLCLMIIFKN